MLQPSPLNEKVLRDKRKKLKETFDRVMRLYVSFVLYWKTNPLTLSSQNSFQHNDEPEHWADLKRKEVEYEKKRLKKQQYYESVKHAQSVQVDEIPLPAPVNATTPVGTAAVPGPAGGGHSVLSGFSVAGGIRVPPPPMTMALPPYAPGAPPGVGKNSDSAMSDPAQAEKSKDEEEKDWLGVPPGPPPDLFAMSELDSNAEGNSDYDCEAKEEEHEQEPPRTKCKNKGSKAAEPSTLNMTS